MGLRSDLYRSARFLGDMRAASRGLLPFIMRLIRRWAYRAIFRSMPR